MSTDWYLIKSPHYTEGTEKTDFKYNSELGMEDILTDSPLASDIILCKGRFDYNTKTFEEEFETQGIIQGVSVDTQTKGYQRQLITRNKSISDYKYVKVYDKDYDRWDIWLIMTMPSSSRFYEKVVLYLCNYIVKWQDNNGNIIYQPFHVENASQYNTGEEDSKILTLGYNQLLVYTSLDDNTVYFNRSKRMFIDYNNIAPLPYRITRIDTVSESYGESRILCLVFTEDEYNPQTDSIEDWLCDVKTVVPQKEITITYTGNPAVRVGGSYKTFTANTINPVTWSISDTPDVQSCITLTLVAGENKCKVKCSQNEDIVDKSFVLVCDDGLGNTGELTVNIVGGV